MTKLGKKLEDVYQPAFFFFWIKEFRESNDFAQLKSLHLQLQFYIVMVQIQIRQLDGVK